MYVLFDQATQQSIMNDGKGTILITDKEKLKEIAAQEGLDTVPDRIEYEYVQFDSNDQAIDQSPSLLAANNVYWLTAEDKGSGHYSSSDLYKEFYVDGPDNFTISESVKKSSYIEGQLGIDIKVLEAKIGFKIGVERDVKWESKTNIAANEKIRFRLFTTYHKVNYWEWHGLGAAL